MFDSESTDVVESIPIGQPRVFEADLGHFIDIRTDLKPQPFSAENLFVDGPALYVFGPQLWPLRQFYESLFPSSAIQTFGHAFSVRIPEWETSWLRRYGWAYRVKCGDLVRQEQVLTLFQVGYTFSNFNCGLPMEHLWRARWLGPPSKLRFWHALNEAKVTTSPGREFASSKDSQSIDFEVETGAEILIREIGARTVLGTLYVRTPMSERLPYWEWVEPIPLP